MWHNVARGNCTDHFYRGRGKTHSRHDMSRNSSYKKYSYNEIENLAKQKAMMKDENYYKEK